MIGLSKINYCRATKNQNKIAPECGSGEILAETSFTEAMYLLRVHQDITHEKEQEAKDAELARIRQEEQLRAMNQGKLASLGKITTGIAHEINQPLTFINTLLHTTIERFQKGSFDVAKLTAKFERAIHQAARINTIIDHLRTFGRDDEKKLAPVNMETILDNSLILMQERIRLRNIFIERKIEENLPSLIGNSHTLEQVFINFFQNSLDAMLSQDSGKVMIAMGHDPGRAEIWLSFADSGPGMSPEVQHKIFEPFFTTKAIDKGTGLGLSLVFGIVKDHGGEIVCHSELGKPTTIAVTLPLHPLKEDNVVRNQ